MGNTVKVRSLKHFAGEAGEGQEGRVTPGHEWEVSRQRAADLHANGIVEYADEKDGEGAQEGAQAASGPVWTSEESFRDEPWSPEVTERRDREALGEQPESPQPGQLSVIQQDEQTAAPDATKGEVTRGEVAAEDEKPRHRGRKPKGE